MTVLSLKRRHSPSLTKWGLRGGSVVAFALGWEIVGRTLNSLLMPTFSETMLALVHALGTWELWRAMWISNQAMVLGFALAAFVGSLLGVLMGRWRAAERFLDPYLNVLLVTPKSALIPILIMATGLGLTSRVLIIFSYAFVVITVNVRAGLRLIDPAWVEMAQSFGATERQLWRKVFLPGALPAIVTGLRLGLARSVSGMVTVELLFLALGFGRLILYYQGTFESASLYATVFVVAAEAVILLQGCKWLERRLAPWSGETVGDD